VTQAGYGTSPKDPPQDDDFLFFGFVIGADKEWRAFSLSELTEARPPWECPIERDLSFKPECLSRAMRGETAELSAGGCETRVSL
jgi:hypothetical protein